VDIGEATDSQGGSPGAHGINSGKRTGTADSANAVATNNEQRTKVSIQHSAQSI
jgi:hypothetical protein